MIWRAAMVIFALATVPALAQDTSSSSSVLSSVTSSLEPSSSAYPAPAGLTDADLDLAVRAAYTGASAFAAANKNYFARDGVFPPLRDAVAAELTKQNFATVTVPADPVADIEAGRVCLSSPGTELRIATNTFGDGVTLIAVTETRYFAYAYDPHQTDDIKITPAADCIKPN